MDTGDLLSPGPADASVRPARPADAASISAIQARAWRLAYRGVMPDRALDDLTPDQLLPRWQQAVAAAPSPRHAVLVACAGSAVVGFAAIGPATDPDTNDIDGELLALEVDPAHQRAGHGSRLLSAAVDALCRHGFGTLRVWCPDDDQIRREFLGSAGLRPDGARRRLRAEDDTEMGAQRLAAALPS